MWLPKSWAIQMNALLAREERYIVIHQYLFDTIHYLRLFCVSLNLLGNSWVFM